jgi:ketosteroid isomerase-like protein
MTDRLEIEQLLRELYAARTEGQLDRLCALFAADATFRIAGASDGKPIAITARGSAEIRAWLAVMLKTFKLTQFRLLSMVIDGARAAVHWQVDIHSKITGVVVPTELVDLVEVSGGRITAYREFFAPC